jgi:hypothetical protein
MSRPRVGHLYIFPMSSVAVCISTQVGCGDPPPALVALAWCWHGVLVDGPVAKALRPRIVRSSWAAGEIR